MAKITLKIAEGYLQCCPVCGNPESRNPVARVQEDWLKCNRCGTVFQRVWRAAGGGEKNEDICT